MPAFRNYRAVVLMPVVVRAFAMNIGHANRLIKTKIEAKKIKVESNTQEFAHEPKIHSIEVDGPLIGSEDSAA